MRRSRSCGPGKPLRQPRWIEICSTGGDGAPETMGFIDFRIHGWRRPVLAAARPFGWLHARLLFRWGPRELPSTPGDGGEGPPGAGVREPRRPSPFVGAGGVVLPEPGAF